MSSINLSELLQLPTLPDYLKRVDQQLNTAIKTKNLHIRQPALRIIQAGGKRLRPALLIAIAQTKGTIIDDKTIQLAAAVELVHIGSLVHDDIIDEAHTRWNIPTINVLEGSSNAIIIGDYMFATACALASNVGQTEGQIVAQIIADLCDGQSLELANQYNLGRSLKSLHQAINGKTASLLAGSCRLGGLAANLNAKQLTAVENFGRNFGLAFQLIDDLMDLVSTTELYGKPVGNDVAEGIYSLPILLGLKTVRAPAIKKILITKKFSSDLTKLLFETGMIDKNLQAIQKYNQQAYKDIQFLNNQALQDLPNKYLDFALTNLVDKKYRSNFLQMQKV